MIIEGIVTTTDAQGRPYLSPMGPVVDLEQRRIELRPFSGSTTLTHLLARPAGVFHCTDDALLIVQAVTKRWVQPPELVAAQSIAGWVLPGACVWHEFTCGYVDQSANRVVVSGKILHSGRGPDFSGFNRAKHGLIEAAITLSRLQFLPREEIEQSLSHAARVVEKTGGPRERQALDLLFAHLTDYQQAALSEHPPCSEDVPQSEARGS
ncbi:MAG: DUF447 domain-containing protein [Planctomycetota bacterium]|jgi:hypothetical protein